MYGISKDYRGKGYTTQAAKGLIGYLFNNNTEIEVLNAVALECNLPSIKVIQKCGFSFNSLIELDGKSYQWYTLHSSDWMNRSESNTALG